MPCFQLIVSKNPFVCVCVKNTLNYLQPLENKIDMCAQVCTHMHAHGYFCNNFWIKRKTTTADEQHIKMFTEL